MFAVMNKLAVTSGLWLAFFCMGVDANEGHSGFSYCTTEDDPNCKDGPAFWADTHPACGGSNQSPIDIENATYDPALGDMDFVGAWGNAQSKTDWELVNNGHSVQINIPNGNVSYKIQDGGLPATYTLLQAHFHWDMDNLEGSEHQIDGKSYPLEMHLVLLHSDYSEINDDVLALPDGLAVLSVLFELGECDDEIAKIVPKIDAIKEEGASTLIEPFRLFLESRNFYRYHGSLTTPGCSETVVWTVMADTLSVCEAQLDAFRTAQRSDGPIAPNHRPIQSLGDRQITKNFD